ncbi:MAG: hypothetical protein HY013_12620 [Candidatus Solibacter usitatus]|nr:hypothetical protein [Candidatus Solibacter usitatus]
MPGRFITDRIDAATDALADPPIASGGAQMFVARHDLLRHADHFPRTHAGIQTQITQGAIETVNVLLQPEGAAVKGARHVEGAVAVPPAPVAERDQHLILGHELAVEPGEAGIGRVRHGRLCYLSRINLPFARGGNAGPRVGRVNRNPAHCSMG